MSERLRQAIACLDLTGLGDGDDAAATEALARRAHPPQGPVAALCVWPDFVTVARAALAEQGEDGIPVATVANFPDGDDDPGAVADAVALSLEAGAAEIDLVLPWRALARGEQRPAERLLARCRDTMAGGGRLKVIIESGMLETPALIDRTSRLAIDGGADFIKTATGKTGVGATPQAAAVMLDAIRATGGHCGFKAAGGLRTAADAETYLSLAAERLGTDWVTPGRFRLGGSALLDALLAGCR